MTVLWSRSSWCRKCRGAQIVNYTDEDVQVFDVNTFICTVRLAQKVTKNEEEKTMETVETFEVNRKNVEDLVTEFTGWLEAKNIIVYSVVHHTSDMKDRGVDPGIEAWTVIFGNPLLGAAFLTENPSTVVDIPLRVGFYQPRSGPSMVVRRHMRQLLSDFHSAELMAKSQKADDLIDQWIHTVIG